MNENKLTSEDISKLSLEELQKKLEETKRNRGNVMMPNASTVSKKKEAKKPREIF